MAKQSFTADEIKDHTKARFFTLRKCRACGTPTSYRTGGEDLQLTSACGCLVKGVRERPASWEQLAEFINRAPAASQARILRDLAREPAEESS